jgi:hypothetical protein
VEGNTHQLDPRVSADAGRLSEDGQRRQKQYERMHSHVG